MQFSPRNTRARPWLALLGVAALVLAACDDQLADQAEDFELDDQDDEDEDDEPEAAIDEGDDEPDPDAQQLAWATSDVGSAGHTALVNLAALLNREWQGYQVDVLPTAGAVQSVIGYATGEFDGYYGADIAFFEMAQGTDRFEGFEDDAERWPVQTFWAYPMETGLAVHARDADSFTSWGDLGGEPVFTGPAPWDVRANLERAMAELDVGHEYIEVDTGVAGTTLDGGEISGLIAYTAAEANPPPWLTEAELQTDMHVLNPSDEEIAALEAAGFEVVSIDTGVFETDMGEDSALFVPFFYGFHVGLEVSEDDVYEMLEVIDAHADELAEADSSYAVLGEGVAELQRRGVEASIDDIEVHPGLARWMQDQGVWDDAWDDRIAQ
jgi:TRAP-type uncharacterized transport system substrate-binding protein